MDSVVQKLLKEIEELERQIEAHPFGSLFDKKRSDQLYQKLRKKRKELAKAGGSVSPEQGAQAVTPPAPKDTTRRETPAAKPKARKPVEKKTPASGAKATSGGAKTGKKAAPRKATTATKGKTKTSRSTPARKTTTLTKKKK